MRKSFMFFLMMCLIAVLGFSQTDKQVTPDQQKEMEAYAKAEALNENHEFFKKFVGDWNVTVNTWMAPGQPPATAEGKSHMEVILGGRYLMMKFNSNFFGQPFEGIQIIGYDNMKKKYNTFWIDNTSTNFFLEEGIREGNIVKGEGMWPNSVTHTTSRVHDVLTWNGPDEYTYELYMTGTDGKDFKSMEQRCKRIK